MREQYLGLSFPTMQGVEMMNGALRGRPWVGQNLEDVKIVAKSVGGHQQHSYNKHKTHARSSALGITSTAGFNMNCLSSSQLLLLMLSNVVSVSLRYEFRAFYV